MGEYIFDKVQGGRKFQSNTSPIFFKVLRRHFVENIYTTTLWLSQKNCSNVVFVNRNLLYVVAANQVCNINCFMTLCDR